LHFLRTELNWRASICILNEAAIKSYWNAIGYRFHILNMDHVKENGSPRERADEGKGRHLH